MADADVVFVIDPDGWYREFRSWQGVVGRHMVKVTTKEVALSRKSAPGPGKRPRNRTGINYAKGRLQNQIYPSLGRWGDELEGKVFAVPRYAKFVHEGTKGPYPIFPKKPGGVLRFWSYKTGRWVFAKSIPKHPGIRRTPFLSENLRAAVR